MKTQTKLAFGLLGVAVTASACGGGAAVAKGAQPVVNISKPGPCNSAPGMLVEPKTTPATPTASSCWAGGMYVGDGSLQSKQIIFASKMADLEQYEATSATFADPTAWAAWTQQASKYISATGINVEAGLLATQLNQHQTFALPAGNPQLNSGFAKTDPAECQSSIAVAQGSPSPQYLVVERNISQKSVTNGKLSTTVGSWTDVIAKVGNQYTLVDVLPSKSQVPPCAG